jgi:hypothetical protein
MRPGSDRGLAKQDLHDILPEAFVHDFQIPPVLKPLTLQEMPEILCTLSSHRNENTAWGNARLGAQGYRRGRLFQQPADLP